MIGHYIVSAFRTFRRHKAVTLINILRLALGLAAFIVAYSVVRYMETAERHFTNADRIYIVSTELGFPNERRSLNSLVTAEHVAKYVRQEFPALEAVVRAQRMGDTAIATGSEKTSVQGIAVDPAFLEVFNLTFLAGDASTALARPRSALITDPVARRLFGSIDVLGKRVTLGGLTDVTVTGIIEPLPDSSSFDFGLLASWDVHEANVAALRPAAMRQPAREQWLALGATTTYVLLPDSPGAKENLRSGLASFADKYVPADQKTYYAISFNAVALSSLQIARLDQFLFSNVGTHVSVTTVLMALGSLILALACINYANHYRAGGGPVQGDRNTPRDGRHQPRCAGPESVPDRCSLRSRADGSHFLHPRHRTGDRSGARR